MGPDYTHFYVVCQLYNSWVEVQNLQNLFYNLNNTGVQMLDSIYHMT